MPAVSILLTSYNYAAFIGEAIASVQAQTWTDWELLVVDDGSTDDSVSLIAAFAQADARIRLLRHGDGGNHGLVASMRLGLGACAGNLVAFLESDDAWRPDCLSRRMAVFLRCDADVVFNMPEPVGDGVRDIRRIRRYLSNLRLRFSGAGSGSDSDGGIVAADIRRHLWLANAVPTFSCVMVRRELLRPCDFSPPVSAWLDWWLWFQLGEASFVFLDAPLTRWRIHSRSYSASVTGSQSAKKDMLRGFCVLAGANAPFWTKTALRLPPLCLCFGNAGYLLALRIRSCFRWLRDFITRETP